MIPEEKERFLDLTRRALAGKATTSEQRELSEMLGKEPSLKAEYERLGKDLNIAKEILPLMKASEAPLQRVPERARARLQAKVRESLEKKREVSEERRGLLEAVLSWAKGAGTEEARQRRLALIAEIPDRLLQRLEPGALFDAPPMRMEAPQMQYLRAPARRAAPREEADDELKGLIDQLRVLQTEIRKTRDESAGEMRSFLEQAQRKQEQSMAKLTSLERQSSEIEDRLLKLLEALRR